MKVTRCISCANPTYELTITDWDPVSKQPHLKFAAVWLMKS